MVEVELLFAKVDMVKSGLEPVPAFITVVFCKLLILQEYWEFLISKIFPINIFCVKYSGTTDVIPVK